MKTKELQNICNEIKMKPFEIKVSICNDTANILLKVSLLDIHCQLVISHSDIYVRVYDQEFRQQMAKSNIDFIMYTNQWDRLSEFINELEKTESLKRKKFKIMLEEMTGYAIQHWAAHIIRAYYEVKDKN